MKMLLALTVVCTLCFTILFWIESPASSRLLAFWQGKTYGDSTGHPQKNSQKSGTHKKQKHHNDTMNHHQRSQADTGQRSDKLDMQQIH